MLAVNKMDLVDYDQDVFDEIVADYTAFAKSHRHRRASPPMPISGFKGDNITDALGRTRRGTPGPTLIEHLETVEVNSARDAAKPFRMPVQWVNRPNLDFRGFSGLIATGTRQAGRRASACCPRARPARSTPHRHRSDGDLDRGRSPASR